MKLRVEKALAELEIVQGEREELRESLKRLEEESEKLKEENDKEKKAKAKAESECKALETSLAEAAKASDAYREQVEKIEKELKEAQEVLESEKANVAELEKAAEDAKRSLLYLFTLRVQAVNALQGRKSKTAMNSSKSLVRHARSLPLRGSAQRRLRKRRRA